MIKITKLNKYYNKNKSNEIHVINDSTIEFPKTGLVTIFGESGCGKTTLLNVLGGLDDFHSGTIEIDDLEINKYNPKIIDRTRNEKIGFIFQNYLLLTQRTVYENLKIILDMYKLDEEEKNDRIDYVLKSIGMLKYKKKKISELSGGQQQRIGIARALIKSPSLILADEPTGNLDEKNTIEVMNILKKISKTTLVILVSHEQSIVNSYSDYVIKVKDGKIISQNIVNNTEGYKKDDDQNLYLKDFEYKKLDNDNVNIEFFDNSNSKIDMKIVYNNGKYYISSSQNIVLLDDDSEIKMIDEHKKEIIIDEEITNNSFELSKLKFQKNPRLSIKDIYQIAKTNLKKLKNRTRMLSIPLFFIVLIVLLTTHSMILGGTVDKKSLTSTHSDIYNIKLEKAHINTDHYLFKEGFEILCQEFMTNNPNIETISAKSVVMKYTINSFNQLEQNDYETKGFSLLYTEHISEKELYYGRMPKTSREIIVEKWVLERMIEETTLGNFMNVKSFINEKVKFGSSNYDFTIVGIADTDEHAVYMNKWHIFDIVDNWFSRQRISICSLSELSKYIDVSKYQLSDNQCLWNTSKPSPSYDNLIYVNNNTYQYEIIDQVSFGNAPFDMAVADNQFNKLFQLILNINWEAFNVFCENEQEQKQVSDFIDSVREKFSDGTIKSQSGKSIQLKLFFESEYDELLTPYIEEANKVVRSRLLITASIILISIIIVYFSMKSYAMKNIYDIGVYRAIGIKKSSVVNIYLIQILIISLKTTLVGGLLCFAVTNIIGSVPVLDDSISISFGLFSICTFGLMAINILIGILPILKYLSLTPTKILTKYDI